MASHAKLTGKHQYVEFKDETIANRVKKMVEMREAIKDVSGIHVRFSYGNRKTGAAVPSVSLIPIADCSRCEHCKNGCYDVRNVCCYQASQKMRANNSRLAHEDPERFFNEVSAMCRFFSFYRWFCGGDILDDNFFEGMVRVAKENPGCQMLSFTKNFPVVNRWIDNNGDLPKNLHIIFSEWRGQEMDNPHNLPTSRPVWPGDEVDGIWCGGSCTECARTACGCWSIKKGQRILFEAH